MATITRRVCDIDHREEDVQEVHIRVGNRHGSVDLCDKCRRSVAVQTAFEATHAPARKTPKGFVKTVLPPQP